MSILLNNKLLQATEAQIEANLTGQTKEDYLKDRKSTRLNSSHVSEFRMPSSA